ncbi:MAG: hypothetical protein RRZ31_02395, partial [Chryseobacterium sp.]
TGVYPDTEKEFTEDDLDSQDVESESFILEKFPKTNILRLAGLMGDQRLLKNYNITNLDQLVNHIHYADICSVVEKMLNSHSEIIQRCCTHSSQQRRGDKCTERFSLQWRKNGCGKNCISGEIDPRFRF